MQIYTKCSYLLPPETKAFNQSESRISIPTTCIPALSASSIVIEPPPAPHWTSWQLIGLHRSGLVFKSLINEPHRWLPLHQHKRGEEQSVASEQPTKIDGKTAKPSTSIPARSSSMPNSDLLLGQSGIQATHDEETKLSIDVVPGPMSESHLGTEMAPCQTIRSTLFPPSLPHFVHFFPWSFRLLVCRLPSKPPTVSQNRQKTPQRHRRGAQSPG